jgi:Holliday junction resolvasome RuvABC endonuclease subunit
MSRLHTTRILGIDPGTNALGYGIIDIQGEEIHVLDSGTVRLAGFDSQQVK